MTFDCWHQHAQQQKRGVGVRDTWVMEKETAKMLQSDSALDVHLRENHRLSISIFRVNAIDFVGYPYW
jgi:hypothetical protein